MRQIQEVVLGKFLKICFILIENFYDYSDSHQSILFVIILAFGNFVMNLSYFFYCCTLVDYNRCFFHDKCFYRCMRLFYQDVFICYSFQPLKSYRADNKLFIFCFILGAIGFFDHALPAQLKMSLIS